MPRPERTFQKSNTPVPLRLPKGTLQKIDFGEHTEEVKRIWEGKPPDKLVEQWKETGLKGEHPEKYWTPPSMSSRYNKVKQIVGLNSNKVGYCSKCRNLNEYLVKYKMQGITIIERFCSEHVPRP